MSETLETFLPVTFMSIMKNTHTHTIQTKVLRSNERIWVHPFRMDERRVIQDFLNKYSSCQAGEKGKTLKSKWFQVNCKNEKVAIKLK